MNLFKTLMITAVLSLGSCASTGIPATGKIVSDCTGTYLRIDGKDYLVCNRDVLKNYREGSTVSFTYQKVKECPELDGVMVCMMYHENEGMIRVKSVK